MFHSAHKTGKDYISRKRTIVCPGNALNKHISNPFSLPIMNFMEMTENISPSNPYHSTCVMNHNALLFKSSPHFRHSLVTQRDWLLSYCAASSADHLRHLNGQLTPTCRMQGGCETGLDLSEQTPFWRYSWFGALHGSLLHCPTHSRMMAAGCESAGKHLLNLP